MERNREHEAVHRYLVTGEGVRPSDEALARYERDIADLQEMAREVATADFLMPDPSTGVMRSARAILQEGVEADARDAERFRREIDMLRSTGPAGPRA